MPLFPSDFKKFKHVKSDKDTTTLEHPKGHQIIIAHKALSKPMQAQLAALSKVPIEAQTNVQAQEKQDQAPRMADGGYPEFEAKANQFGQKVKEKVGALPESEQAPKPSDSDPGDALETVRKAVQSSPTTPTKAQMRQQAGYADGGNVDSAMEVTPDRGWGKIIRVGIADGGGIQEAYPQASREGALGGQNQVAQEQSDIQDKYKHMQDYTGNPDVDVRTSDQKARAQAAAQQYGYKSGGPVRKMYAEGDDIVPDYSQGVPEESPDQDSESSALQLGRRMRDAVPQTKLYHLIQIGKAGTSAALDAAHDFAKGAGLTDENEDQAQSSDQSQIKSQPSAPSPLDPVKANQPVQPPMADNTQDQSQAVPDNTQDQSQITSGNGSASPQVQPQSSGSQPVQNQQTEPYLALKQAKMQETAQEIQSWNNDLANGHIQPKTYSQLFADKGTLGKIGSIFGMILSGFGSGLTHQPNMAFQMMDNEIQRDMQAQVNSKDNAVNYLRLEQNRMLNQAQVSKLNTEQQTEAFGLAKMRMNSAALHELSMKVSKMTIGSPQRQQGEQALAMASQYADAQHNNLMDLISSRSAYNQMVMGNQQNNEAPASQIRKKQLMGIITPEQSKEALKEVQQTENHVQLNKNALDSFDTVANLATARSNVMNPIQNEKRIDAEWNPMMDKLTKDNDGRVTPITVDMMSSLKPRLTDNADTLALKRNKMNAILNGGLSTPTLDSIGVRMDKGERSGPTPRPPQFQEGQTGKTKAGQPAIYRNGQWVPK